MKGLNRLYWLKIEIEKIENQIVKSENEIEKIKNQIKELTVLSSPKMNGTPGGNSTSSTVESYNERLEELKHKLTVYRSKLIGYRSKLIKEQVRIENYIEQIKDDEVRVIARMRFIDNKSYDAIGSELFIDRTTASKKLREYIERN